MVNIFLKQELLEISVVNVPANAEALVSREYKSFQKAIKELDEEADKNKNKVVEKEVKKTKKKILKKKKIKKEEVKEEKGFKTVERWNKQLPEIFNRAYKSDEEEAVFDISRLPSNASAYDHQIYSKYLDCQVKDIYLNSYAVPSPMLGTYLKAFKEVLGKKTLKDERNFGWNGGERPLMHEVIRLTAEKSEDFLIEGAQFYEDKDIKFIIKFHPGWFGMNVDIVTLSSQKEMNKGLLNDIHEYAKENNQLKGQIFALSGEFLKKTTDKWEDLVLPKDVEEPIKKAVRQLKKNSVDSKSRGLMFVGSPGTGKTKTGKVLMNDYEEAAFIWVSSKDFGKIGSTYALKMAFSLARDIAPSILFLEDIDSWINSGAVDLLKSEMDGIRENKGMVTILTSNNPEKFPDALLDRPGRFHEILNFPLPNKALRKQMLEKWCVSKMKDEVMIEILKKTKGFSGAHIRELVDYAEMIKEDDGIELGEALLESLEKLVKQRELINELKKKEVKPKKKMEKAKSIDKKKEDVVELPDLLKTKPDNLKEVLGEINDTKKILVINTISSLKETIKALEGLLKKSEPITGKKISKVEKESLNVNQDKGKGTKNPSHESNRVLKALRIIDRGIEYAIKLEKERKNNNE